MKRLCLACLLLGFSIFSHTVEKRSPDNHAHSEAGHAHESHDHQSPGRKDSQHDDHHEDESSGNSTTIAEAIASQVGVSTIEANSETLRQTITSYGTLATGAEQLSHMRARFSGLITKVKATIGDKVKAGDLLAEVESNESLRKYAVRAPISGTVIQRHANTGEVTQDQILFSIANFDTLWAELRIYPAQRNRVSDGQAIEIVSGDHTILGTIAHIIPALDKPYQLARVMLDNQNLGLSPGLLVEGRIVTSERTVTLAVEKAGVQTLEGRQGVFVLEGETYHFRPLTLGIADDRYIEVLDGLQPRERYVNQNSYLIKADIEKSEAEHEH